MNKLAYAPIYTHIIYMQVLLLSYFISTVCFNNLDDDIAAESILICNQFWTVWASTFIFGIYVHLKKYKSNSNLSVFDLALVSESSEVCNISVKNINIWCSDGISRKKSLTRGSTYF